MTTYDFSPLFRSTVGFDRLARMVQSAMESDQGGASYPPYNIERRGDDAYRITLAVAGFAEADLDIEARENVLTVTGRKTENEAPANYLYRGIAGRDFQRKFQLADHVKVQKATLDSGLLNIDLVREVPETLKPRKIEIGAVPSAKLVEGEQKKVA